jgi:hypothetical protein
MCELTTEALRHREEGKQEDQIEIGKIGRE